MIPDMAVMDCLIGHKCNDYNYMVKRELRSGARLLLFECGHIQFRQKTEVLPRNDIKKNSWGRKYEFDPE